VVPVNAPGFVGPKNLGNKLGAEALLDYVIGTEEPASPRPTTSTSSASTTSGELAGPAAARRAGHPHPVVHLGDGRYHEVAQSHRAAAAMMVCSKSMINVARKMEERYGILFEARSTASRT
jgi:nitrogenase molybdenum-cofactor synthesis protein NifE